MTNVAVADAAAAEQVGDVTYSGPDAVTRLVEAASKPPEADVVLNALVGALGLQPTLAALASGARLALANKESLVAGGPLVLKAAQPGQIVPVDSEHSALAQCLRGGARRGGRQAGAHGLGRAVPRLVGSRPRGRHARAGRRAPHLEHGPDEHAELGVAGQQGPRAHRDAPAVRRALRPHRGGGAPAVDRALDGDVHRRVDHRAGQPARHETADLAGARLAGPGRRTRLPACDFSTASTWEFEPLDATVFPAVDLARHAGRTGGCLTAVYNAANEEAAAAFLAGRIRFPAIVRTIADVLHAADQWAAEPATVEDVLDAQRWARQRATRTAVTQEVASIR